MIESIVPNAQYCLFTLSKKYLWLVLTKIQSRNHCDIFFFNFNWNQCRTKSFRFELNHKESGNCLWIMSNRFECFDALVSRAHFDRITQSVCGWVQTKKPLCLPGSCSSIRNHKISTKLLVENVIEKWNVFIHYYVYFRNCSGGATLWRSHTHCTYTSHRVQIRFIQYYICIYIYNTVGCAMWEEV